MRVDGHREGEVMDGRTPEERDRLRESARDDEQRADELSNDPEDIDTYAEYLRRRADWKRWLAKD